jgi:hypothetical protein
MGRKKKATGKEFIPLMIEITPATPAVDGPRLELIRERALSWARENGLKGELDAQGPERVNYPVWGHGYVVTLRERDGQQRLATARFDHEGNPSFWTMDGRTM